MSFVCVNEEDKFAYDDCIVNKFTSSKNTICLELEALIVKADNSQNSQYTESYAGDTTLLIEDAEIFKLVKEGYKYYDANDKLIEEVPDAEEALNAINLNEKFSKVFLINLTKVSENEYSMEFEMPNDIPGVVSDVYEMKFKASKLTFKWNRFMNRVGK